MTDEPLAWAVDTRHLPLFRFPRECRRGTFSAGDGPSAPDAEEFVSDRARRVHAIESGWLEARRTTRVVAYRMPPEPFAPHPEVGGYWVSSQAVEALEPVEMGDLLDRHAAAEIELRIVPTLWPLWDRVTASTLEFSGIRRASARPAFDAVARLDSSAQNHAVPAEGGRPCPGASKGTTPRPARAS